MLSVIRMPTRALTTSSTRSSRSPLASLDRSSADIEVLVSIDPCPDARPARAHRARYRRCRRLLDFYFLLGAVASAPSADPDTVFAALCWISAASAWSSSSGRADARRERQQGSAGLVHLGFALGSADAVDELSEVLAGAGHRVLEPPHRTGGLGRYESVVLDPDGTLVKLTV